MTREAVEALFRRAFGIPVLREEDRTKAAEVAAMLVEIARIAGGGKPRTLVDLGCGHAYVGLAARALLPDAKLSVVGIDHEPTRVRRCEEAAARLGGGDGLRFVTAAIDDAPIPDAPDLVVALHACGTATDAAITRAIAARAKHALFVPCCHRRPLDAPRSPRLGPLEALRRRAEQDLARAARLEDAGYEVVAVEVWPTSISPANVMLRARATSGGSRAARG